MMSDVTLIYGGSSAGKQYSRYLSIVQMYIINRNIVNSMFNKQDIIRAHSVILNSKLKFYGQE